MNDKTGFELPDWLDIKVWNDFLDHRKLIRAPLTPRGKTLNINTMERIINEYGETPRQIADRTIENGWRGFFPPRENARTQSQRGQYVESSPGKLSRAMQAIEDFEHDAIRNCETGNGQDAGPEPSLFPEGGGITTKH